MPVDYDKLAADHGGTAVDYDALAAQHGGTVEAAPSEPDGRNRFQKAIDGTIDYIEHPENRGERAPKPLTNFAGGTVRGSAGVLAHPLDALSGMAQAVIHPFDTAKGMYEAAKANPAQAAGMLLGGAALGEVAGPVSEIAGKVGGKALGRAALLGKTPEGAYESALKPSTTLPQAQRAAIVKTGLEQGIPVSKSGLEKIGGLIEDYNQKIADTINADPARPIDPNKVATRADTARAKFAKQVNASGDLAAIESSKAQFLSEQGATPTTAAPAMNASDAQAMKQGTYRVLKGKFGEQGSASVEAQKALARGLKEEIAIQFPEITKLNAAESRLLDLQPILERAVGRISNHQLIGIGTPIAGEAAKAVTGSTSVGAVATALKAVLDNPAIKSRLAISISKGAKIPYAQAAAKVGTYTATLGKLGSNGDAPTQ